MNAILPPRPSDDPLHDDALPRKFGKYTLLRRLSRGGMAELFLALQRSVAGFEKLIVVKRILPAMHNDASFIAMFLHEARIAATLAHPNVVQVYDVGQVENLYFIAMEHVHGEDVRAMLRQMRAKGIRELPLEHVVTIGLGMSAGLAYAHDKRDFAGQPLQIVHRDISPQNVVVSFTGDIKVVDFGVAKSDTEGFLETQSGKLKGKVPYMSPEQARGEKLDARADIFSLGIVLYELSTGRRLFKAASEYETLRLICESDYPRPSEFRADYPPLLEAIVMKALSKDRELRYSSARELQEDLEEFVRSERIAASSLSLARFMQMLFAEKLSFQREALLAGKQLADIIELRSAEPSVHDLGLEQTSHSQAPDAPLAPRSLVPINVDGNLEALAPQKKRSRAGGFLLAASAVAVLTVLGFVGSRVVLRSFGPESSAAASGPSLERAALYVASEPAGASIWIDGELHRERTPAALANLPTDRTLAVRLTRDGFEPVETTLTLERGLPMRNWDATLRAVEAKVDATPKGTVDIGATRGWCTVTIDGAARGSTPLSDVELPVGVHRVVCVPGDGKAPKSADIEVKLGAHTQQKFNL